MQHCLEKFTASLTSSSSSDSKVGTVCREFTSLGALSQIDLLEVTKLFYRMNQKNVTS